MKKTTKIIDPDARYMFISVNGHQCAIPASERDEEDSNGFTPMGLPQAVEHFQRSADSLRTLWQISMGTDGYQSNISFLESIKDVGSVTKHLFTADLIGNLEAAREKVAELGAEYGRLKTLSTTEVGATERQSYSAQALDALQSKINAEKAAVDAEAAAHTDLGTSLLLAADQKLLDGMKRVRDAAANDDTASRMQQQADQVQKTIGRLRVAAETAGKSPTEIKLFELHAKGASDAQEAIAQMYMAQADAKSAVTGINAEIAKIGQTADQSKIADMTKQLEAARAALPKFGDADPHALMTIDFYVNGIADAERAMKLKEGFEAGAKATSIAADGRWKRQRSGRAQREERVINTW